MALAAVVLNPPVPTRHREDLERNECAWVCIPGRVAGDRCLSGDFVRRLNQTKSFEEISVLFWVFFTMLTLMTNNGDNIAAGYIWEIGKTPERPQIIRTMLNFSFFYIRA